LVRNKDFGPAFAWAWPVANCPAWEPAACELGAEVFMPLSVLAGAHRDYRDVP
jgi:hypothetical protein